MHSTNPHLIRPSDTVYNIHYTPVQVHDHESALGVVNLIIYFSYNISRSSVGLRGRELGRRQADLAVASVVNAVETLQERKAIWWRYTRPKVSPEAMKARERKAKTH